MSSTSRQFFRPADLAMIDRVLDRANFCRSIDPTQHEARLDAARFLIANFQQGATDERELQSGLANRMHDKSEPAAPSTLDIADKVSNAGLFQSSSTSQSYQFGKRIETNGSWTIYHVFTGVPAKLGNWKMVQLDVKTAVRALKTLNAPERKGESAEAAGLGIEQNRQPARSNHVSMADRARAFDKYD